MRDAMKLAIVCLFFLSFSFFAFSQNEEVARRNSVYLNIGPLVQLGENFRNVMVENQLGADFLLVDRKIKLSLGPTITIISKPKNKIINNAFILLGSSLKTHWPINQFDIFGRFHVDGGTLFKKKTIALNMGLIGGISF